MPTGKKGKGKKVEFLIDSESLRPYEVQPRDMVQTPLGVDATVLGVNKADGLLWLQFPGGVQSPVPTKATTKAKATGKATRQQRRVRCEHSVKTLAEEEEVAALPGPRANRPAATEAKLEANGHHAHVTVEKV